MHVTDRQTYDTHANIADHAACSTIGLKLKRVRGTKQNKVQRLTKNLENDGEVTASVEGLSHYRYYSIVSTTTLFQRTFNLCPIRHTRSIQRLVQSRQL